MTQDELTQDEIVEQEIEPVSVYPVSLNFNETDLLVVLNTLAELRPNTSVVIDPGVAGTVTINIKTIAWEKALQLILEPRGLVYEIVDDNIYRIHPSEMIENESEDDESANQDLMVKLYTNDDINEMSTKQARKLYGYKPGDTPISDAQLKEELLAEDVPFIKRLYVRDQPTSDVLHAIARAGELNYSLSKPETSILNSDDPNQPAPFQEVEISLALKMVALEDALTMVASRGGYGCFLKKGIWEITPNTGAVAKPLMIEHFEVEYLEVGNNLVAALKSSLTTRGSITPGMNKMLIVKDTEDGIEQVRRTLKTMDKQTPQVLIEARFFELTSNDSEEIGLDWAQIFGKANGLAVTGNAYTLSQEGGGMFGLESDDALTKGTSANTAIFETAKLETFLRALKNSTNAEQLSNPKIIVASDQQATIHIGSQEPMIDAEVTTSDGVSTTTYTLNDAYGGEQSETVTLLDEAPPANTSRVISGYLDLGTKLTVAPSVKTDEDIYMKVLPKLTTKTDTVSVTAGGATVEYPILNVTSVYSEFSLKSGQSVAIGGLVKEEDRSSIDKIPFFGYIPLLGRFFTYTSISTVRSETIVFLTVTIVGAEKLKETSGVPIHSELAQPVIEEIRDHDAAGSEYQDIIKVEKEETMIPDWAWDLYMEL